jgi:putative heme iron utilization protein
MRFGLGDFDLWRIEPQAARYVGGFAQAYNLTLEHFKEAGKIS